MKKVVSLLVVLFLFTGLSFATQKKYGDYSGVANFSDSGSAEFGFDLYKVGTTNKLTTTEISWSTTTVGSAEKPAFNNDDVDNWVLADQYAVVSAAGITKTAKVYMYQTNTEENSSYSAKDNPRHDGKNLVYNGLYSNKLKSGIEGYVPVAYSMRASSGTTVDPFDGKQVIQYNRGDRFFKDKADYDWGPSKQYIDYAMIANEKGVIFGVDEAGENPWPGSMTDGGAPVKTAYMYFFGNFRKITGGDKFGTDQLHIVIEAAE